MTIATDRNAQDARIERDDIRLQIADAQFLKVFLELHGEARAARWRGLDFGAKFRLVARQMTAQLGDWNDADVRGWIERYDAKYAIGPLDAAVEGALERLAGEHSAAARLAVSSGDKGHATEERRQTKTKNIIIQNGSFALKKGMPTGGAVVPASAARLLRVFSTGIHRYALRLNSRRIREANAARQTSWGSVVYVRPIACRF